MVEKLRRKFVILSVLSVAMVLLVIAGTLNISNYIQIGAHADELLDVLAENNGHFPTEAPYGAGKRHGAPPKELSPETPFSTRFFTVRLHENGLPMSVDTGKVAAISTSEALHYAETVAQSARDSGFLGNYKYRVVPDTEGSLLIFVDCGRDLQLFRAFLRNSMFIGFLGISAVFLLLVLFSKKAIAPVAESYAKQTQFITDASHELKTPLAIIGASTEVLELNDGENEWTRSIRTQVEQLSTLVSGLVSLSRMDEETTEAVKTDFSLSDAVWETAEPFQAVAQQHGKVLLCDIEANLSYCGEEPAVRQLVGILLDNAVRYAAAGAPIRLSLARQGKHYILKTTNAAADLERGSYDLLFERFYRADRARNRQSGGYGIGLSIAKAIVLKHKGSIHAESLDGKELLISVRF